MSSPTDQNRVESIHMSQSLYRRVFETNQIAELDSIEEKSLKLKKNSNFDKEKNGDEIVDQFLFLEK